MGKLEKFLVVAGWVVIGLFFFALLGGLVYIQREMRLEVSTALIMLVVELVIFYLGYFSFTAAWFLAREG